MPAAIEIRALRWPEDAAALAALDTSLVTDRIYELVADERSFTLREVPVDPPLHKRFPLDDLAGDVGRAERSFVAEIGGTVAGFASLRCEAWNRRAILTHLYVDRPRRQSGIGRRLLQAVAAVARERGARELWLETQNVNFPAIAFYRRAGFELCGLDRTLYDPAVAPGEVALYFARTLAESD
jgi:ribosomal protein S18 acetylase RimI-like enzyme